MSGDRLLLDTNIVIYLLSGDKTLADILHKKIIYLSFISQLELLRYTDLSGREINKVREFIGQSTVIDINHEIKENVIALSKGQKLKLPDCIILATALYLDVPVLSSDKNLLRMNGVNVLYYQQ